MTGCVLESVAQGSQAKAILLSLVSLVDPEHIYCPKKCIVCPLFAQESRNWIHLTWMGSLMPPNPSSLLKPLLTASPTIPASMTMVGLSATPLLLTVLLKPALTILVLLSLLLQLRFLPFPRPLFPSFLTSTLCDLILVGFPLTESKQHLMPPLSITVLPCSIPSANILSHVFLPPTSTASPNGLPPILSSLMCPPMMIVSLAMVDAPCCSSMEVSAPTSLPATPCRQKLPCPKLLKILFMIMAP